MNGELGFTPEFFGWAAGVFFIGYCLFEAPSNYIMHRVGARMWIARIMVSWGVVRRSTAFIWNETSFVVLRLLLGVMEAGFAPGVILYLTYWIPAAQRARILAGFLHRGAGVERDRIADLRADSGDDGRRRRNQRLALAVPDGGAAVGHSRDRLLLLSA